MIHGYFPFFPTQEIKRPLLKSQNFDLLKKGNSVKSTLNQKWNWGTLSRTKWADMRYGQKIFTITKWLFLLTAIGALSYFIGVAILGTFVLNLSIISLSIMTDFGLVLGGIQYYFNLKSAQGISLLEADNKGNFISKEKSKKNKRSETSNNTRKESAKNNDLSIKIQKDPLLKKYESLAKSKDVDAQDKTDAQYNLGLVYSEGTLGVQKNYQTACKWFHLAAKKGDIDSQYNLGAIYLEGRPGIPADHEKAREFFLSIVKKADESVGELNIIQKQAYNRLGSIYALGKGVKRNYTTACEYWVKAAKAGHVPSKRNLAFMDSKNLGLGDPDSGRYREDASRYNLGVIYLEGRQDIQADHEKAREIFLSIVPKADESVGELNIIQKQAYNRLGSIYALRKGVKRNYTTACEYWVKAAKAGHVPSQRNLASMYSKNLGFGNPNSGQYRTDLKYAGRDYVLNRIKRQATFWLDLANHGGTKS